MGELLEALAKVGGSAVIGADHGNCEQMWDSVHNAPHTSHTLNLVEFFVVGEGYAAGKTRMREGGRLADIAPTVLHLMGLPKPAGDDGREPRSWLIGRGPRIGLPPPAPGGFLSHLHASNGP